MVTMTRTLIDQGHAYAAEGHVLFAVETYERYGALAGRSLDDMLAGSRVEVAPYKKNPMDFVLWKPSTPEQPGWDSPWGRGRPGWHIECSAMAQALLGDIFDIHGGGIDLAFPHHENEVAQSCCANHTEVMANVWMHNGFLQVEGEKMAKSLGNFFTVNELLHRVTSADGNLSREPVHPLVLRLALLMTQYRSPLDWSVKRRYESSQAIKRWTEAVASLGGEFVDGLNDGLLSDEFLECICDDLNTPGAFNALDDLVKLAKRGDRVAAEKIFGSLKWIGLDLDKATLRIIAASKEQHREGIEEAVEFGLLQTKVNSLLEQRSNARKEREFARADAIRKGLIDAGVVIKDSPQGTEWELSPDFDAAKLEALR
jgi:cysteinyl-tRNA synthetase